jgi:hypothetical protein
MRFALQVSERINFGFVSGRSDINRNGMLATWRKAAVCLLALACLHVCVFNGGCWIELGPMESFCENGNELSGSLTNEASSA